MSEPNTNTKIATGLYPGTRWTVLGPAQPGRRRGGHRARVKCRCACGDVEQPVFIEDLRSARSKGCPSVECRTRFAAAQQAMAKVEALVDADLEEIRKTAMDAALAKLMEKRGESATTSGGGTLPEGDGEA